MIGDKMTCGIYCIECLVNHNEYIGEGISIEGRWRAHRSYLNRNIHHNQYLQRAWNKYGEENFKFYIVEKCDKEELNEREIYYIKEWGTKAPNGYNMTDGGDGIYGFHHSEETKIRISENSPHLSGKDHPMYGTHASEESRNKMSVGQKKRYLEKGSPLSGRTLPEEHKKNIKENHADTNGEKSANFGRKFDGATSQYHGVRLFKDRKYEYRRWRTELRNNGKLIYLGSYKEEIDAAKAYDKYIIENNLPNPLNFPEDYK